MRGSSGVYGRVSSDGRALARFLYHLCVSSVVEGFRCVGLNIVVGFMWEGVSYVCIYLVAGIQ